MKEIPTRLNQALIDKYGADVTGPYYTSYPTLSAWTEDFSHNDYQDSLNTFFEKNPENDITIYIHYPFCKKLCFFCICNAYITSDQEKIKTALEAIKMEIGFLASFFEEKSFRPRVTGIHFGGGSPSYIGLESFAGLMQQLRSCFDFSEMPEIEFEIDPRTTDREKMKFYATMGINRISMGIQDFDPQVQKAINRIQPFELIKDLLAPEVRKLYPSVNFDLLYGLPFQTRETFRKTIQTVMELKPERITLLRYAHEPRIKKHMSLIKEKDIAENTEKTNMFLDTIEALVENGYEHIGIDHFARPQDELAKAFKSKTVGRTFNGFTVGREQNILGIGPGATSTFGNCYSQNVYDLSQYYKSGLGERFPVERGYKMSPDDFIRRDIIFRLLCDYEVDFSVIEEKYNLNVYSYFQKELVKLSPYITDNLVTLDGKFLKVTSEGKFCVRHICKCFDFYYSDEYKIHGT